MSFLYPLGLLGLIAIPILILIYILKSKYRESVISSTYIWELSDQFLKKKSPLSKLNGLLSLILQIFTAIFISLTLAHPILTLKNAANNYCFILDTSASMNMESEGITRFTQAKEEILKIVESAKDGSQFTIIEGKEEARSVIEKNEDKQKVTSALSTLKVTTLPSSLSSSISIAQSYFDEDPSLKIYLVTDKYFSNKENLTLINVTKDEENASINSVYYMQDETTLTFNGSLTSYNESKNISLSLLLDDVEITSVEVSCQKDEETPFNIVCALQEFNEAIIKITTEDALSLDNEYHLFGSENIIDYKALLVSDEPFYLKSALATLGSNNITVMGTSSYTEATGYDLYVFDNFAPTTLPTDGSIWLFAPTSNITNAGFIPLTTINNVNATLTLNKTNNSISQELTKNMLGSKIAVNSFVSYNLYNSFTEILTYESYPMVFAGTTNDGNREIVFSFDLHKSNFPLALDYMILIHNMISYSIPAFCEKNNYQCGDDLFLNIVPQCESIQLTAPSSYSLYLSTADATVSYTLSEMGVYTIEALIAGVSKTYKIYSSYPLSESNPLVEEESALIIGSTIEKSYDSFFDTLNICYILLLLICLVEWGVYCVEQHNIG